VLLDLDQVREKEYIIDWSDATSKLIKSNSTSFAKKRILMINWDSYPNVTSGGVYSWGKALVENLRDCKFTIINVLSNPGSNSAINVPDNVEKVICVPLFGSFRIDEYLNINNTYAGGEKKGKADKAEDSHYPFYNSASKINSFMGFISRLNKTDKSIIRSEFIPLFMAFLQTVILPEGNIEFNPSKVLRATLDLHNFFKIYDTKKCLEHNDVWKAFQKLLQSDSIYRYMSAKEALNIYKALQRNLQLLAIPVSKFDIIHSSVAWLPSLIGLIAKTKYNIPFILTEHGVAFKELLLYYNTMPLDQPSGIFWRSFSLNMIKTFYRFADRIAPVCYANARWEKYLIGKEDQKINVIYNGIDTSRFTEKNSNKDLTYKIDSGFNIVQHNTNPDNTSKDNDHFHFGHKFRTLQSATKTKTEDREIKDPLHNIDVSADCKREYQDNAFQTYEFTSRRSIDKARPIIVFVGRIDPFKDIVKLLIAISYVRKEIPEILCKIYGTASNIEYASKCINALESYGLQDNVLFMGSTKSPEIAYSEADVVAISSVSEGFPFSVIEAMACGKIVVATNVGGVAEALEGSGFLVTSAHPRAFADALILALNDEKVRKELGKRAQAVAQLKFSLSTMIKNYEELYNSLIQKSQFIANDDNNNQFKRSDAA
jgi:glycosyltransferase involved in cell wall biosynthesis